METIHSAQTGDTPALVLDVEGVFLVVDENRPHQRPSRDFIRFKGTKYDFYNPRHGRWIEELQPDVEPYWLTGVNPETLEQVASQLGLSSIPEIDWMRIFAHTPRTQSSRYDFLSYKRDAIDYVLPDRRVIWVDDWLAPYDLEWARERQDRGIDTLLIRPDSCRGLKYRHIQLTKKWLGEIAAGDNSI